MTKNRPSAPSPPPSQLHTSPLPIDFFKPFVTTIMVFSAITGFPMLVFLIITNMQSGCRFLNPGRKEEPIPFEFFFIISGLFLKDGPVIENSHNTMFLLFGMIQSAFFCNVSQILFAKFQLVHSIFPRIFTMLFGYYAHFRTFHCETILIPKIPMKLHWKSLTLISLFFASTGYFMHPYCVSERMLRIKLDSRFQTWWNMMQHYYVFILCVEASIWYYTEEFRLFCRRPLDDVCLYHKAYYITVYRKIGTL
ncbi:hypothetical protein CAEBREN_18105 [Caenorhabditis brenneri]|uniref:Uncharacterized protein n=1 Tax=Caenorhabditis brenneri TaxID=135651 RepID=G0MWK8_CAEBE|nr:hypothetical protein CAEBREN_18105 [Caenorhabditis brenneri]